MNNNNNRQLGGFSAAMNNTNNNNQQQQGAGGFSSFSGFGGNNNNNPSFSSSPSNGTIGNNNKPTYIFAKGSAAKVASLASGGGLGSARSMGSMSDLMNMNNTHSNNNAGGDAAHSSSSSSHQQQQINQGQIKHLIEPLVQGMKMTTFYDIMSSSSLVVVLDINSTVAVCVAAAQESRASCFLVWDPFCKEINSGRFATILTLTNFIQILIHCHENQDQVSQLSSMPLRELLKQDFARPTKRNSTSSGSKTDQDAAVVSNNNNNTSSLFNGSSILHANPEMSLYDLLGIMIENDINHVPILADSLNSGESSSNNTTTAAGSNDNNLAANHPPTSLLGISFLPQLLSQVVRVLNNPIFSAASSSTASAVSCQYSSLFDVPLSQIAALSKPLSDKLHSKDIDGASSWLLPNETVHGALHRLIEKSVQSLPVIDENGCIIDTFSRSDVIGLEDLGVYNLNQAVKLALDTRSRHRNIVVCQMNDKVGDVVAHFVATGVRTIFVVGDVNEEFLGQIQVSDLLKFLYDASK